ncbi:MAG: glycine dehydrogenase (aminomethyl-transferring), partial [Verrucomicrobiaceae bacterium]
MPDTSAFSRRHIGPTPVEIQEMVHVTGCASIEELVEQVVPGVIRKRTALNLPEALTEEQALGRLKGIMSRNRVVRSFIGLGFHDTFTPPVIQRNIFENPGWYTAYTPYQPEISQGRLEALLNYQTMICDLTGLDVSNASLLDEGTAVAEACHLALESNHAAKSVFVSDKMHPHVIDVVRTRMESLGIEVLVGDVLSFVANGGVAAVCASYPDTLGVIHDLQPVADAAHKA